MIRGAFRTAALSAPHAYALGHQLCEVREEQGLTRGQVAVAADLYARALGARIRGTRAARVRRP
ncbi:hypothetical protein [Streptomyces sp. NPDC003015]